MRKRPIYLDISGKKEMELKVIMSPPSKSSTPNKRNKRFGIWINLNPILK